MDHWNERQRPICLEKRFEFSTYGDTRDFLDRLGRLSEAQDRFPDLSFGKTYVNVTLRPASDDVEAALTADDHAFAQRIDELID